MFLLDGLVEVGSDKNRLGQLTWHILYCNFGERADEDDINAGTL